MLFQPVCHLEPMPTCSGEQVQFFRQFIFGQTASPQKH